MIALTKEEAQQVLGALEFDGFTAPDVTHDALVKTAIETLRARLSEKEQEPVAWNKSIRDSVDSLLAQAGFELDSSVRHQLAMMNFESTTVPLKNWRNAIPGGRHTDQWESCRVADYNKGWNEYRKAAKAALEKLEVAPPPPQQKEQEPVAWTVRGLITDFSRDFSAYQTKTYTVPLYPTPPQSKWQGLTDEEVSLMAFNECAEDWNDLRFKNCWIDGYNAGSCATQAKLKEKNT